jgi:hypothetical protein
LLGEHLSGTGLAGLGVLAVSLAILYHAGPRREGARGGGRPSAAAWPTAEDGRNSQSRTLLEAIASRREKAGRCQRGSGPAGHEGTSRDHEPTWLSRQPLPGWPACRL